MARPLLPFEPSFRSYLELASRPVPLWERNGLPLATPGSSQTRWCPLRLCACPLACALLTCFLPLSTLRQVSVKFRKTFAKLAQIWPNPFGSFGESTTLMPHGGPATLWGFRAALIRSLRARACRPRKGRPAAGGEHAGERPARRAALGAAREGAGPPEADRGP